MNKRAALFLTIFLGITLHISALLLLHDSTFTPCTYGFKKTLDINPDHRMPEKELAEIFAHLSEAPLAEVNKALSELKEEPTPPSLITLPAEEEFLYEEPSIALTIDLPDIAGGDIALTECDSSEPQNFSGLFSTIEPPKIDFSFEAGLYDPVSGVIAGSEHFSTTIEYAPRRFYSGYVFKITFHPKPDIAFKRIRQTYFFLLDRSNSIPRLRYFFNKKAVSEAINFIKPQDGFNILTFDDRVVRFADLPLPANEENINAAREFLEKQGHGGHFAATDLYASLGKILPTNVSDQEVNTAILLSAGDTYLSMEKQRQTIGKWTLRNQGKVALFSLASGEGNNISLLQLITSFNKGSALYVPQNEQVAGKLAQFLQMVQNPIGKKMRATAIPSDPQNIIFLEPKNSRLPDLYQNTPFTIWGTTNRLSEFTLFLQGNYYDCHFDIKKKICFPETPNGTLALERQWVELLAQDHYENYFREGKKAYLDAVKELLSPLNLPTPLIK